MEPHGNLAVQGNRVTTPGGYVIEAHGGDCWSVTSPTGRRTGFNGATGATADGAAVFSGGQTHGSYFLPDGTKLTMGEAGSDSGSMDIYYGNQRVHCDGMDGAAPVMGGPTCDAAIHDIMHRDGRSFFLGGDGDDWFGGSGGGLQRILGDDNGSLGRMGEYWIDTAHAMLAQMAGLPAGGDTAGLQLPQVSSNQTTAACTATGTTPGSIFDRIQETDKSSELQQLLAGATTNGSFEDLMVAVMQQSIDSEMKKARGLAGNLDKSGSSGKNTTEFDLQVSMQRISRLFQTMTNIVKSMHDAKMAAVRNMKA
ncbi:hypothetical protein JW905_03065, partial [bacterium]|nr:hypothetical protein [candidate division CSSED10-310 bacterium]